MRVATWLAAFGVLCSSGVAADEAEPPELHDAFLHADVPLWGSDFEHIWPRGFSSGMGDSYEFGCASRVAFGDWSLTFSDKETRWVRFTNYGVFHCAAIERSASERSDLEESDFKYAYFVKIDQARVDGKPLELWVLQSGHLPGSTYALLAREPSDGVVKSFIVLQRRCPSQSVRRGPPMDVWQTEYCAINSKAEMISLAKRMARLAPLGTLQWIDDVEEPNADK